MRAEFNHESPLPLKAWVRALEMTAPIERNPSDTLPIVIEKLADQFGSALALADDHERMTYRELAESSNQYARWALRQGVSTGDVICLLMPNCPQYVAIWLGITRVGGIVSLLNTNLTGESLAHAINIVAPSISLPARNSLIISWRRCPDLLHRSKSGSTVKELTGFAESIVK